MALRRSIRIRCMVAVPALGGALLLVGPATQAVHAADVAAVPNASYSGTAEAWGVRTRISNPGVIPLGLAAEPGGPLARVDLNSLGGSTGLASLPYPGDDLVGLPDLVGAVSPELSAIPSYPLLVLSDAASQPTAEKSSPLYTLKASSTTTASSALAQGGVLPQLLPVGSSTATGDVSVSETGIVSKAASLTQGFSLGGVVEVGTARASAGASRDASGRLKRSSNLLFGLTIAGLPIGVGNGQLVTGGLRPGIPIEDVPALQNALKQGGIEDISYQRAVNLPNGIRSAGLRIVQVVHTPAAPPDVAVPCGPVPTAPCGPVLASTFQLIYQIGTVEATANLRPFPAISDGTGFNSSDGTAGPLTPGPALGEQGNPSGITSEPPTATGPLADGQAPELAGGQQSEVAGSPRRPAALDLSDSLNIYLVLVALGLLMSASVQLLRHQGVRTSWT